MTEPTPAPVLFGFTITRDELNQTWVAVTPTGKYRVVGRSQSELEQRRDLLFGQIIADYAAAIREVWPRRDT